jgi:hypothetical protein
MGIRNKKSLLCFTIIILIAMLFPLSTLAHSGRTDANGGHYDKEAGEYHYHHGYPAHYHTNGKCPYNNNDKTNHNSGSSSNGSNINTNNSNSNNVDTNDGSAILFAIISVIALFLLGSYIWHKIRTKDSFENDDS